MHLLRILIGMVVLLILGVILSGCGGGTTSQNLTPITGDIQVGVSDAAFTPSNSLNVNFVSADFESVNAAANGSKQLISEVPFTFDGASGAWQLAFSNTNHPKSMEGASAASGQFYMTLYVLLNGEASRRQVGSRYLVTLDIPAAASNGGGDSSGPPKPPWTN